MTFAESLKPMPTAGLKCLTAGSAASALPDASKPINAERIFRQKYERREVIHNLNVRNAVKLMERLPEEGEVFHILLSGSWHGFDFVSAILSLAEPETIEELAIASLGFSDANSGELLHLLDSGKIRKLWMAVSCYMRDASAALYQPLLESLTKRGQAIRASRQHAKLLCFKMSDGRCFVVDGSANLRSCRNVEQANVWQSRELFDFYSEYIRQAAEGTEHVK